MSTDFYFERWLQTLVRLEECVNYDIELQTSKHNDKKRCAATQTLIGVMAKYCSIYNDAIECLRNNTQLQKTAYMAAVVNAVVARIVEIKHQVQKLESSKYQFLGQGLVDHKITVFDAEMKELPNVDRMENMKDVVEQAFEGARRRKEELEMLAKNEEEEIEEEEAKEIIEWWNDDHDVIITREGEKTGKADFTELYKVEEVISEESLERRNLIAMIQAHERSRKVIQQIRLNETKRVMWTKQLAGTLNPEPRLDIKERSAMFIQKFFRSYFELKRQKSKDCHRDELLGLRLCKRPSCEAQKKAERILQKRVDLREIYKKERAKFCEDFKRKYSQKSQEIAEDFRDYIRHWFKEWHSEIKYFYDIPPEKKGGSNLIVKDEVPVPSEWLEQYQDYLRTKSANKGKTALQLKYEKQSERKEDALDKRKEIKRKKRQAELLKKIMKNPTLHPGFTYPKSKKTEHILTAIKEYQRDWNLLDLTGDVCAKERTVKSLDIENLCMDVKMEVRTTVDLQMREELKLLKVALKKDYEAIGEKMPEGMKVHTKRKKAKKIRKEEKTDDLIKRLEDLVLFGVLKENSRTNFEDFIGEYNFAGNEYRCLYIRGQAFGGETRNLWWEKAREAMLGFQRILLVGPRGSGKTILAHALATANDSILLELDLVKLAEEQLTSESLAELLDNVVKCTKALQPCVIYIRHVHRLYYRKQNAKRESTPKKALMRKFLVGKLCKKINKDDKITVIASCVEPWLTKSAQLMKKFPAVVLVPNTNYTTVVKILSDWVLSNRAIPSDLNVHGLAHMLQGFTFGFLKSALDSFLTAERTVKIAAYGLQPQEVYDYIMEFTEEVPVAYDHYLKWYYEKTEWGKKETKSIQAQLEFQALKISFEEKAEKKKAKARERKQKEAAIEAATSSGLLTETQSVMEREVKENINEVN